MLKLVWVPCLCMSNLLVKGRDTCASSFCFSQGNMPPSAEGDAKSSVGKEKKPIRRLKGSLGSFNMITEQNNTDMDKLSGGTNGALSHG